MPTQVTNYQCPACTGPMHFDSAEGKLKCDYCGSTFEVAEIEALYDEKTASPPRLRSRRKRALRSRALRSTAGSLTMPERNGAKTPEK